MTFCFTCFILATVSASAVILPLVPPVANSPCAKNAMLPILQQCLNTHIDNIEPPQLRTTTAIRLTLCELSASRVKLPNACFTLLDENEIVFCMTELEQVPNWWTSYSGWFQNLGVVCQQYGTEYEKDRAYGVFVNVTNTFEDMNNKWVGTFKGTEIWLDRLNQAFQQFLEDIMIAKNDSHDLAREEINQLFDIFDVLLQKAEYAVREFDSFSGKLDVSALSMKKSLSEMEVFIEHSQNIKDQGMKLDKMFKNWYLHSKGSLEDVSKDLESISRVSKDLLASQNLLDGFSIKLKDLSRDSIEELSSVLNLVSDISLESLSNVNRLNTEIGDTMKKVNQEFSETNVKINVLKAGLNELGNSLNDVCSQIRYITSLFSTITNSLSKVWQLITWGRSTGLIMFCLAWLLKQKPYQINLTCRSSFYLLASTFLGWSLALSIFYFLKKYRQ